MNYMTNTTKNVYYTQVEIGPPKYRLNWVVINCCYEVLPGMQRRAETHTESDYKTGQLRVERTSSPPFKNNISSGKIGNPVVQKFSSLHRISRLHDISGGEHQQLKTSQIVILGPWTCLPTDSKDLEKLSLVFKNDLLPFNLERP